MNKIIIVFLCFGIFICFINAKVFAQSEENNKKPNIIFNEKSILLGQYDSIKSSMIPGYPKNLLKKTSNCKTTFKPDTVMFGYLDTPQQHCYTYNSVGNLLSELFEYRVDNQWRNNIRYNYTCDSSGNMLVKLMEIVAEGNWLNNNRLVYTFDEKGNMLAKSSECWLNNNWEKSKFLKYTYNLSGDFLSCISENWENGAIKNYESLVYTYDFIGNIVTEHTESYSGGILQGYLHVSYTYDQNNRILTKSYQTLQNGVWESNSRVTYSYNSMGSILNELSADWYDNKWNDKYRLSYLYDDKNNKLIELGESKSNEWNPIYRYSYTYNNDKNLLLGLLEENNLDERILQKKFFTTYAYDQYGNLTSTYSSIWKDETSGSGYWKYRSNATYNYDNYGNCIKANNYEWNDDAWVPSGRFMTLFYNNFKDSLTTYGENITIKYKPFNDSTNSIVIPKYYMLFQNYPNPFNPATTIKYSIPNSNMVSIKVFDILGKEVTTLVKEQQNSGQHEVTFNAEKLSSGTYFYQLKCGEFTETKKLLLLK